MLCEPTSTVFSKEKKTVCYWMQTIMMMCAMCLQNVIVRLRSIVHYVATSPSQHYCSSCSKPTRRHIIINSSNTTLKHDHETKSPRCATFSTSETSNIFKLCWPRCNGLLQIFFKIGKPYCVPKVGRTRVVSFWE